MRIWKTILGLFGFASVVANQASAKPNNAPENIRETTHYEGSYYGSGQYIPRKHTKQTYGQQRRAAKKRNNKRKFN